jgi:histidinol-phosphate phosphatase family protein
MTPLTQAVIFCGGRGTRLGTLTDHLPKPMIPIIGKPFLAYALDQLRRAGFRRVVLLTGYLGEQIQAYFGNGNHLGMSIEYSAGPLEWETGQRLWEARQLLDERFLLMYGDNFVPFRAGPLCQSHETTGGFITVTVSKKTPGNIQLDDAGRVKVYDPTRRTPGLTHVEIGYMLVERDPVLRLLQESRESFSVVLEAAAKAQSLGEVEARDAYHSISDPQRWKQTEEYLRPKNIILLDRDGVLNQKAPRWQYVAKKEEVVWIPQTIEALEDLGKKGFEFIVLSNQAGINRRVVEQAAVDELHAWMTKELGRRGIVLRDFFVCPHDWEEGCACRKPEPGLFFEASRKHALRLDRTVYVGDDIRDAQAATRANCSCLLVQEAGTRGEYNSVDGLCPQEVQVHGAPTLVEGLPWIEQQFASWEMPNWRGVNA